MTVPYAKRAGSHNAKNLEEENMSIIMTKAYQY